MDKELIALTLEAIAAEAKILAMKVRNGQLWDGDLKHGLGMLSSRIAEAAREESKPK